MRAAFRFGKGKGAVDPEECRWRVRIKLCGVGTGSSIEECGIFIAKESSAAVLLKAVTVCFCALGNDRTGHF